MRKGLANLCSILLLSGVIWISTETEAQDITRKAAFAGSFYPAGKASLEADLQTYFNQAASPIPGKKVRAIIVPHAGYAYSGQVAAAAYNAIPANTHYENIFIIASSHRTSFNGASVYSLGPYETPLGRVEVNREIADLLIRENKRIQYRPEAHTNEHSIEVQLPMIQHHFTDQVKIIPIVIGSQSPSASRDLALALLPWFTPHNLFVISSDFSHYPKYDDAIKIDKNTCEAILSNSPETFYNTLRSNSQMNIPNLATSTCGWTSIMTLMYMTSLNESLQYEALHYRNSEDVRIGDKDRVVGYWAIAAVANDIEKEKEEEYLSSAEKQELITISRETLEKVIRTREYPDYTSSGITGILNEPAGAFVSLYMNGRLRGCIGNFMPEKPLFMVVQEMTAAAALNDQRFAPVEASELDYITIEISVLTPLRKIQDISEFELGKHGIYIKKDERSGTFLPQVAEGTGWMAEEFISRCSRDKAGLGWDGWKTAELYVYEAIVFGEK